ncbi:MAG: S8 family serine peptidase [Chthonomonas sp.]|nr:S8 family serine peptidase [Chthonomonas sp.]
MNISFPPAKLGLVALALATAGMAIAQTTNTVELNRMRAQFQRDDAARSTRVTSYVTRTGEKSTRTLNNQQQWIYDIAANGKPIWRAFDNLTAARNIGATDLWGGGKSGLNLDGSRAKVGVWDSGADITIGEFGGRIRRGDNFSVSDHGMHVSGTIWAVGLNPQAKGMSYNGSGVFYDAGNDDAEIVGEIPSGLMLSNHSYGFLAGWVFNYRGDGKWVWLGDPAVSEVKDFNFGMYSGYARQIDQMLYSAPFYLYVASAGNKHGESPDTQPVDHWVWQNGDWASSSNVRQDAFSYEQIGSDKMAKNMMTVGATEKLFGPYTGPNSVRASGFGSWGPSDDGRVKPDITAPGVDLVSTVPGGYAAFSGTSMSSPTTTGGLSLLQDLYVLRTGGPMRASMLKAVAFHTAKEAGEIGPDYIYGWGLLDVSAGATAVSNGLLNAAMMQNITVRSGQVIDIPITARSGQPLRVTANWTDPAGTAVNNVLDSRTPTLVNDIDVQIIDTATSDVYLPWKLDPENPGDPATRGDNTVDNTEQCQVDDPDGQYIIRISHKGASLAPAGSQIVSVVISADVPTGLSDLELSPGSVIGGVQNSVGTVTLAEPAAEPLAIELTSSDTTVATVPSVITANTGDTSVNFTITTKNVRPRTGNQVPVTISATSDIGGRSAVLSVLPIGVASVELTSNDVIGGNNITGKVHLNAPAPTGGVAVALRSDKTKDSRPTRNWIYVPAGNTFGGFTVRTSGVNLSSDTTITAVRLGLTASNSLRVNPATMTTFTATPGSLRTGPVTLKITLNGPAGPAGQVYTLSSSNSALLSVPQTMKVPSGKTTITVVGAAVGTGSATPVTITATRGSVSQTATVNVGS